MIVTLDEVTAPSDHLKTFWFYPETSLRYLAGQFVELSLTYKGQLLRRWFTLSSSPTEQRLGITTKFCDYHSPYKQALLDLKPGAKLTISDPMGDFVLPKDPAIPLVFVAGGIGITPVRSIVTWLRDTTSLRNITLLYGVNHLGDLAFSDLFDSYSPMDTHYLVKDASANWAGSTGILNVSTIKALKAPSEAYYYISGPEPMVGALTRELHETGIPAAQIISDYFSGYTS
jgi:ferredoxin-NADP reductase